MKNSPCAVGLILAASGFAAKADDRLASIKNYERSAYSRDVTSCDTLAAHPGDPERVADGVSQALMNKPAALAACHEALEADPENPRLNYQQILVQQLLTDVEALGN